MMAITTAAETAMAAAATTTTATTTMMMIIINIKIHIHNKIIFFFISLLINHY